MVYAEDNDNLFQADVTACYMEQGRAQLAHLLLEVTGAPLLQVAEVERKQMQKIKLKT